MKLGKTTQASPRDAKISSYMRALTPKDAPNDEDEAINKLSPWSSRLLTSTSEKASILEMSSLKTVSSKSHTLTFMARKRAKYTFFTQIV